MMHKLRPKLKTQENLLKLYVLGALLPGARHRLDVRQVVANSTGKHLVLSETTRNYTYLL